MVEIDPSITSGLVNNALVGSATPDSNQGNDFATLPTSVQTAVDLSIRAVLLEKQVSAHLSPLDQQAVDSISRET